MPQGTSKNLIGLTNSHTYKNGCVFSAIALQNSVKALPTMLSHELFFFFWPELLNKPELLQHYGVHTADPTSDIFVESV